MSAIFHIWFVFVFLNKLINKSLRIFLVHAPFNIKEDETYKLVHEVNIKWVDIFHFSMNSS